MADRIEAMVRGTIARDKTNEGPYRWIGDNLVHIGDEVVVATIDDFPDLKKMEALHMRQQIERYRKGRGPQRGSLGAHLLR